ncbi:hypothetical protein KO498_06250 [Lentibacter algarum]|uniref:hypothetical protein n=1 Tax=Lentibacter algarum TaxID=576131 RepID=UPI001C06DE26|nr:hypothetical protein [Lentibacter algarum]MBU2981412.1 hypothetical protein [Lentibacter algarum]
MRRTENDQTKTFTVARGAEVTAELSSAKVLRFERKTGAMTGSAFITAEDGALSVHYADGASVHLTA